MNRAHKQKRLHQKLLAISVLLFVVTAFAAYKRVFFDWEQSLFFAIYDLPRIFQIPFWLITQLGSAWLLVVIAVYLLIGNVKSRVWGRRLVVNGVITYILVEAAKNIIARARPDLLLLTIKQKGLFELHGFGFPSGHTAMATIISLTLMTLLPKKWRWLPWLWILLVGISRIYLGVHAPLDIIGGIAVGVSVYCTSRLLQNDDK